MYSTQVRQEMMAPSNGPLIKYSNGWAETTTEVSCRTNPKKVIKNTVKLVLYIEGGVIKQLNWHVFGDPVAIATCSWIHKNSLGKEVNDLTHLITPEKISYELEITDELQIRGGCVAAVQAFIEALDNYRLFQDNHPLIPDSR